MRAVCQRVSRANVQVEGEVKGAISSGLLVFLGVSENDSYEDRDWLIQKIPNIRCFEDANGKMNRSLIDSGGDILLISQFTLYGNLKKGNRPSFNKAASPDRAKALFNDFRDQLSETLPTEVQTGEFGAHMVISAVNDGPVTLILDSKERAF